ncbi:MAG: MMPL family transporter [Kineosporiaceae bacterium]
MLASWGSIVHRARWSVVAAAVAFVTVAGVWGTSVFGELSGTTSLEDPNSEAERASVLIDETFGRQTQDVVGLYTSDDLTVDDPEFRSAVEDVAARVADIRGAEQVLTYYDTDSPALVSRDRRSTAIAVVEGGESYEGRTTGIAEALRDVGTDRVDVLVGGQQIVDDEIGDQVVRDIARAESIAAPILLIALLIVFGSLTSALMPLVIGGVSVLGAFLVVRVITMVTEVSVFSINIITILGLGLAIDYGLFVVNRFREELAAQESKGLPEDVGAALSRTLATAGRTVLISGLLIALALSSLTIFPQVFLRSMGFGGMATVAVAMVTSLTLLPALLAILGRRIDAGRMPWVRGSRGAPEGEGWWARATRRVLRRPAVSLVLVVGFLAFLAAPFSQVHFGGVDARMLPADSESRLVAERLAQDFPGGDTYPIRVLVEGSTTDDADAFIERVESVSGVQTVEVAGRTPDAVLLTVTYAGEPSSPQARDVATALRALPAPPDGEVSVGGTPANVQDQLDSLRARLPLMAALVAGVTFLLLAIGFGSVLVPLKAIVMNVISIGAAFGVTTWIFQEGHLSGLLGFTPVGYIEASQPVLMIAILFGLSMDYEVFLLSRIRERWDEGADMTESVVSGVEHTGKMITAAAVLLCIVIGFFATSGLTFIKMIGVGMVIAILLDATLIRLVLVPATMKLVGRYNWWAPPFLSRLYARYGLHDDDATPGRTKPAAPAVPRPADTP